MRLNLTLCVKCVILCVYLVLLLHSDDKMTVSATTSYIVQVDASTYDDAVAIEGEVGAVNYAFGHIEATTTQILDYDQLLPFTVDIPPMFTQTDDVQWIPAENQLSDIMTKTQDSKKFLPIFTRVFTKIPGCVDGIKSNN